MDPEKNQELPKNRFSTMELDARGIEQAEEACRLSGVATLEALRHWAALRLRVVR